MRAVPTLVPRGSAAIISCRWVGGGIPWLLMGAGLLAAVWSMAQDDGGWYLNAARSCADGHWLPYRDFFFPQGPLACWFYLPAVWTSDPLLAGRLLSAGATLIGAFLLAQSVERLNPGMGRWVPWGLLLMPLLLAFAALVKTHAPVLLVLGLAVWALANNRPTLALLFLGLSTFFRISLSPLPLLFAVWQWRKGCPRVTLALVLPIVGWLLLYALSEGQVAEHLFIPLSRSGVNTLTGAYEAPKGSLNAWQILDRKLSTILRCFLAFPILIWVWGAIPRRSIRCEAGQAMIFGGMVMVAVHLLANRPYDEYKIPGAFLLLGGLLSTCDASPGIGAVYFQNRGKLQAGILFLCVIFPYMRVFSWAWAAQGRPWIPRIHAQQNWLEKNLPPGRWYPFDAYLALISSRPVEPASRWGEFSFLPAAPRALVLANALHNRETLTALFDRGRLDAVLCPANVWPNLGPIIAGRQEWGEVPSLPTCFRNDDRLFIRRLKALPRKLQHDENPHDPSL